MSWRAIGAVVTAVTVGACAAPVLPPVTPPAVRPVRTLLSGQSNAVFVAPYISLPLDHVITVAQSGLSIGAWQEDGHMWPPTRAALTSNRIEVVVWWQGESDASTPHYLEGLRDLIRRMREAAGNPALRLVIVRVLNLREFAAVRRAQEAFVASDRYAALVSTDGFQWARTHHLTHEGYAIVTDRIRAALRRQPK